MRPYLLMLALVPMLCSVLHAQQQGRDTVPSDGASLQLSPEFMHQLEQAFEFAPAPSPIAVPDSTLTRELLHQWVGEPDRSVSDAPIRHKFDSTYFALKLYLRDYCRWNPPPQIVIPGLSGLAGPCRAASEGVGHTFSIDVNALARYVRPSQISRRKMRRLADEHRAVMDQCYPIYKEY